MLTEELQTHERRSSAKTGSEQGQGRLKTRLPRCRRYNIDFYQFSGLMTKKLSSGKKQKDLGKEMGGKSALSIHDMLAKM